MWIVCRVVVGGVCVCVCVCFCVCVWERVSLCLSACLYISVCLCAHMCLCVCKWCWFYQCPCSYSCSSCLLSIPFKNLETPEQTKTQSIFQKEASPTYPEELLLADFPWLVQVRVLKSSKSEIQDVIIRYGTTKQNLINAEHLIMSQQPSVVHIHQLKQVCTEK